MTVKMFNLSKTLYSRAKSRMPLYNYSIELIRNSILNLSSNAQKKFPADLVTFTVQNLNEKLHFLYWDQNRQLTRYINICFQRNYRNKHLLESLTNGLKLSVHSKENDVCNAAIIKYIRFIVTYTVFLKQ